MGYDAACRLNFDRQTASGQALLEQHDLIFRGPIRLAIPLKDITSAVAARGKLTVKFGRRSATFDIGARASKWADRITNPPSRLGQLRGQPGTSVLMTGAVDTELVDEVTSRGARVLKKAHAGTADIVFFGADDRRALE